jgi:hypothetical protein
MLSDPTPVWNTKHRWSLRRSGNLNQQLEPEFLGEIGSRKPDRSPVLATEFLDRYLELPPSDRTVGCRLMEAADELTG